MAKRLTQRQVDRVVKQFRILDNWQIIVVHNDVYYAQCSLNDVAKKAIIYGWGTGRQPKDYVVHEVLHVAFKALVAVSKQNDDYRVYRQAEEELVQDVCRLLKKR